MRYLYLLPILLTLFVSCEDDDAIQKNIYEDCCSSLYTDTTNFKLFMPTTYTPNGDGLNDVYRFFISDSSQNILSITSFKATNYEGILVYSKDTMATLNEKMETWDLTDNTGETVLGTIKVNFAVTTLDSIQYVVEHSFCSYTCTSLTKYNVSLDHTECWYADQLDPYQGFVLPTNEKGCL